MRKTSKNPSIITTEGFMISILSFPLFDCFYQSKVYVLSGFQALSRVFFAGLEHEAYKRPGSYRKHKFKHGLREAEMGAVLVDPCLMI